MFQKLRLLDGGFSTQLARYVGNVDGDPLWTARFVQTNPEAIVKVHLDFLKAGSDLIETCTYQASVEGYKKYLNMSEDEALNLINKAGKLALHAKDLFLKDNPNSNVEVVGSIGPYGAFLHDGSEYSGNYMNSVTTEEIKSFQRPRIKELVKCGISMFAFETIPSQKEALANIELLSEFPNIKAWISFSCKDSVYISNGENFQEAAVSCYKINPKQIIAVGANCFNPLYVYDLFKNINENLDPTSMIPLVTYPNSGEKYSVELGWIEQQNLKPLHLFIKDWMKLGICYIGGCCRTQSEDIALMRKEIDNLFY